jgi:signal transduction histidine kinase
LSYLLVGSTAFVHANSRSFTLDKLRVVLQDSEASNAQLQKATKAKAQFLANMSHGIVSRQFCGVAEPLLTTAPPPLCVPELRTPLHGILAMAREMMDFQLDDAIRECGQIISHCGDHMHSLINDILDFEKIESGQLRLEAKSFSVADVVNHLVKVPQDEAIPSRHVRTLTRSRERRS